MSRAAHVVPHHFSGLGPAAPPGILQPDLGYEVRSVSVVPTGQATRPSGSPTSVPLCFQTDRDSLGHRRDSPLRSAPFEDFLLADSSRASRRRLPPCRSPSEWTEWSWTLPEHHT